MSVKRRQVGAALVAALAWTGSGYAAANLDFQLLTWDDGNASASLPSAVGLKPAAPMLTVGDWLVYTADDQSLSASNNPAGALSHNLVDIAGMGGAGFNMAPSLTGSLSLRLASDGPDSWNIDVTSLGYAGQATPVMAMNQFLVSAASPATQNPVYKVDGLGNGGTWNAAASGNWAIHYDLDFYLATNADGDPSSGDIDATFSNAGQNGHLIPVSQLTAGGLSGLSLDDVGGYYGGDFNAYLLDEIAPRLPDHATYLLVTQMEKVHPVYAEAGLPIGTGMLLGNVTFAYTTGVVPEPVSALMLVGFGTWMMGRRRRATVGR